MFLQVNSYEMDILKVLAKKTAELNENAIRHFLLILTHLDLSHACMFGNVYGTESL